MIARTWRGATSAADADEYLAYLHETGFSKYRATPGNVAVYGLRRTIDGPDGPRAEFLLVSLWESMDAMRNFAGSDPARAVFYPRDDHFLVDRDEHVNHYEVVFADSGNPRAVHPPLASA
ncbi:MAG TPA: hypothetical protein VIQ74_13705 [Gemmatimonadaceae bacterium]|jgi:hypothetical protein